MLHSDTVTFDGAYESIIGMSYAEFNKQQAESRERSRKAEEDWKEQLPENEKRWIEKGIKILSPDKHDIWRKMVPIRARDLYHGMELDASLAIVEVLNNGCSLDEAKHIIDEQGHSGMSFHLVLCMVRDLCARGGEFMSYAA
jgi:hypothetical protein